MPSTSQLKQGDVDVNYKANYRLNYGQRNDHGIFDFNYSDISAVYDI